MFLRIHAADAALAKRVVGYPLSGRYHVPHLPALASPVDFMRPDDTHAPAPPAPAPLVELLEARLATRERGAPTKDQAKIQRRLASLPPCDGTRAFYRLALEAYALPADALPPSPVLDEVARATSAVFVWDVEGKALDDAHARGLEEAARARTLEEAAAREARKPNTKSLNELGLIGVLKPIGSWPGSHPPVVRGSAGVHAEVDGVRGELVVYEKPLGVDWPAGPIAGSSCTIVPGSFVMSKKPVGTRIAVRDWPAWFQLRQAGENAVTTFRDGRSADGEAAEEQLRARIAPFERALFGLPEDFEGDVMRPGGPGDGPFQGLRITLDDDRHMHQMMFVHLGVRAYGLAPDLLWSIFEELETEHWKSLFPSGERRPAREILRDDVGREISTEHLREWDQHNTSRGALPPNVTREHIPAEMHDPAPTTLRRDTFDALVQQAASGAAPFFDVDELFEPPSPGFVARFKDFFTQDGPWRAVLEEVTRERDTVTTGELEKALIDAGVATRFANAEHLRLIRLMNGLGFEKKKTVIDGKRIPAFVKVTP